MNFNEGYALGASSSFKFLPETAIYLVVFDVSLMDNYMIITFYNDS